MTKKITEPTNNGRGRPRKHSDINVFQQKIDEYFEKECKDDVFRDEKGIAITDAKGRMVVKYNPPTVAGLALYLGFVNRCSMYDYIERGDEFSDTIKRAVARIENYAEKQLTIGANPTGAIFWLKNHGWRDKTELEATIIPPQINDDV